MLLEQGEKHQSVQGNLVAKDKSPSADRKYRDLESQLVALRQKNSDLEGKLEQAKVFMCCMSWHQAVYVCDRCIPMYIPMYVCMCVYV